MSKMHLNLTYQTAFLNNTALYRRATTHPPDDVGSVAHHPCWHSQKRLILFITTPGKDKNPKFMSGFYRVNVALSHHKERPNSDDGKPVPMRTAAVKHTFSHGFKTKMVILLQEKLDTNKQGNVLIYWHNHI